MDLDGDGDLGTSGWRPNPSPIHPSGLVPHSKRLVRARGSLARADYVFRADSKSRDAFYFNDGNGHFTRQLNIGLDWIASPHDRSLIFVEYVACVAQLLLQFHSSRARALSFCCAQVSM